MASGVDRLRLGQLLLGFSLFLIPMLTTQLVLPLAFNDFRFNNLGPVFTIFLIIFFANAIINYRIFDIRWIFGRSVFASGLIAIVVWIIAAVTFSLSNVIDSQIAVVVAALIVVLLYQPLWKILEKIFDRFLSFGAYDPKRATAELFDLVRTEGDLNTLTNKIYEHLSKYFHTGESGLFVLLPKTHTVISSSCNGLKSLCKRMDSQLVKLAEQSNFVILEKAELDWQILYGAETSKKLYRSWIKIMEKNGIETLVPFSTDHHLVALLVFGQRLGGRQLYARDISFLNLVRSGVSSALENAAKFKEIKKLYEELAQLDKAKSEFINVVSHRFRTPLSAIRWNLEAVLDVSERSLKKEVRDSLQDTHNRTLFLIDTLDRMFESLAIESGKFKMNITDFMPIDACDALVKEFTKRCKDEGLMCRVDIDPDVVIHGDEKRLTSVCKSFLANAIQYTPKGGEVTFSVYNKDDHTQILFRDTGIGIPPAARPKLFEKFYRAKNAVLTYADGQGLGLYFSKKIIDLHHGKINVDSTAGKGTTFTISLPHGTLLSEQRAASKTRKEVSKKTTSKKK